MTSIVLQNALILWRGGAELSSSRPRRAHRDRSPGIAVTGIRI